MSRPMLESRLKALLGHTVHKEIRRVQIEKVKEMLLTTDLPLKQIARRCGFKYMQHMARVFRQATGETLARFRNRNRRFTI